MPVGSRSSSVRSRRASPRAGVRAGQPSRRVLAASRRFRSRPARSATAGFGWRRRGGRRLAFEPRRQLPGELVEGAVFDRRQRRRFRVADRAERQDVLGRFHVSFRIGWVMKSRPSSAPANRAYRSCRRNRGKKIDRRMPDGVGRQRMRRGARTAIQAAQRREPRKAVEIAADAEAAIACEIARAIVDRQSRQFDRQPAAAVDRPVQRDAAPGVVGRDRLATRPSGSSPNTSAISLHSRPKPAAVRAPIRRVNSSEPSEKRPSASICHMKRSGCRRGSG